MQQIQYSAFAWIIRGRYTLDIYHPHPILKRETGGVQLRLARARTRSHSPRNTATLRFLQLWFPGFNVGWGYDDAHLSSDTIVYAWHPRNIQNENKSKTSLQGNDSSASAREIEILSAGKFRCPKDFVLFLFCTFHECQSCHVIA